MNWEAVVGIEVHAQLRTGRKLFCADRAVFGDLPNIHVCPVCLGLPGALPTLDPDAVALAVRTAVALDCTVHETSIWARKHYFYPDLPKGYQVTQFERPLATDGTLVFDGIEGESTIRIRRVHMEEDAGKSVHDGLPGGTGVDLNRAGTPLVEIVTEPDLRSPADARAFLTALKRTLEFAEVSDCNMEEGSLRADANVSIRAAGVSTLGTKTEIKNVNSFSGIEKALTLEIDRQIEVLSAGGVVRQDTLLWDDHRGTLRPMRSKEESHDYRYFPDPDLPPLRVPADRVEAIREALPELPRSMRARFVSDYGLSEQDAEVLSQSRPGGRFFEVAAKETGDAKVSANWVMGPTFALMRARGETPADFSVTPAALAELIGLVLEGTISDGVGKGVLERMANGEGSARDIVASHGLEQVRDAGALHAWTESVIADFADEVERYRAGEVRLLGFLVGQVMRRSDGKADPRLVNEALRRRLSQ
jgi:aspartyl-tRNA(Asn)/glutamyl-tRNA(Gln) amidotransferase subunit B